MMPQQISNRTTDKIIRGLDKMCDYIDAGQHPNDAAVKVAQEFSLAAGQVELMCRGYNAGAVNAQRRDGNDFAEKFAAVATADAETVNAKLFPKTAAAAHSSTPVAAVYQVRSEVKKKASDKTPVGGRASLIPSGPATAYFNIDQTPYRQATAKLATLRELRADLNRAERDAAIKTAAVEDAIRMNYRDPADAIVWLRKVANHYFGDTGRLVVEKAAANFLPGYRHRELVSSLPESIPANQPEPIDFNRGAFVAIKTAVEAIRTWAEREVEFPKQAVEIRRDIERTYGPAVAEREVRLPLPGKTAQESEEIRWQKRASVFSGAVGGMISKMQGSGPKVEPAPQLVSARLKLNDPDHAAELKAIRAEAMLNDLLSHDDVIASYSPDDVALAFMDLSQAAPDAVDNIALLRANLRRNLQGNLTTHEAKELAQLRSPSLSPGYQPNYPTERPSPPRPQL